MNSIPIIESTYLVSSSLLAPSDLRDLDHLFLQENERNESRNCEYGQCTTTASIVPTSRAEDVRQLLNRTGIDRNRCHADNDNKRTAEVSVSKLCPQDISERMCNTKVKCFSKNKRINGFLPMPGGTRTAYPGNESIIGTEEGKYQVQGIWIILFN